MCIYIYVCLWHRVKAGRDFLDLATAVPSLVPLIKPVSLVVSHRVLLDSVSRERDEIRYVWLDWEFLGYIYAGDVERDELLLLLFLVLCGGSYVKVMAINACSDECDSLDLRSSRYY